MGEGAGKWDLSVFRSSGTLGEATRFRSPPHGDTSELHAGQLVVFSAVYSPGSVPCRSGEQDVRDNPELGSGLAGQDFHLQLQVMR